VASVAPAVPIYRLSTMQQKISSTLERAHFDTFLLAILPPLLYYFRQSEFTESFQTL